jgi:hypothetical protein
MVQDIIWKADCHSACQNKYPAFLWNSKVHFRVHKSPPLDPTWASRIQFALSIPISLRSSLILSSHLRLGLPSDLLPSGLPTKTLEAPLPSHMRVETRIFRLPTWPAARSKLKNKERNAYTRRDCLCKSESVNTDVTRNEKIFEVQYIATFLESGSSNMMGQRRDS